MTTPEKPPARKRATRIVKPMGAKKQMSFSFADLDDDQRAYVATTAKIRKKLNEQWRGMFAVPPGTLAESILLEFQKKTNIPLEVPFFTFLHYLSAHLVQNDVRLKLNSTDISMDFWTVILAQSGAGKTFTHKQIKNALGANVPEIDGTSSASSAAFLKELELKGGRGLWQRDEFLQFLIAMENGGPLAEMKDYLLRIYDNETITRTTKKDSIHVESPCVSILAFNAMESFIDGVNPESLVDGFAQRFSYVLAKADPNRPFENYAFWELDKAGWASQWRTMTAGILPTYETSEEGIEHFRKSFKSLCNDTVPESFYRRVLWKAHKYALLYHILRGQAHDPVVGIEDYGWAVRALSMHLSDASEILSQTNFGDLEKLIQQCEKAVAKKKAAGQPITPRTLLQSVKGLQNASTAKFVFEYMKLGSL